jgi:serine/threonine protein kinase
VLGPQKTRILYLQDEEKMEKWYKFLKKASGNEDIADYYTFGDNLGKGQFGLVKKATHIKTGKQVAVKLIKKRKISPSELDMLRNEIEVLKICQHPNIVHLEDVFEDIKCVYVVLELLKGGDMFEYMNERDF